MAGYKKLLIRVRWHQQIRHLAHNVRKWRNRSCLVYVLSVAARSERLAAHGRICDRGFCLSPRRQGCHDLVLTRLASRRNCETGKIFVTYIIGWRKQEGYETMMMFVCLCPVDFKTVWLIFTKFDVMFMQLKAIGWCTYRKWNSWCVILWTFELYGLYLQNRNRRITNYARVFASSITETSWSFCRQSWTTQEWRMRIILPCLR